MWNTNAWWSDKVPMDMLMQCPVRIFAPFAAMFLNVRSITDACPIESSLVGTFGLLHSENPFPLTHSRVSLVLGHAMLTPSSQSGCLMFQSPVIIIGFMWSIDTLAS